MKMKKINVLLLMAGNGSRLSLGYNKIFYEVNKIPIYIYSLRKLLTLPTLNKLYLIVNQDDYEKVVDETFQNQYPVDIIIGGKTRSESVKNALREVDRNCDILIHDAARPLTNINDINKLIETTKLVGTLYHEVTDTIKQTTDSTITINRNNLKAVTTPQYFSGILIDKLLENEIDYTDELQIFEKKYDINYVLETTPNIKLTTALDLEYVSYMLNPKLQLIGHSYDFHPFVNNRPLVLGGINILYHQGLDGHSDADSLYHAVAESMMGALQLGDLGTLFPDSDMKYKDQDSSYFIKEITKILDSRGFKVINIDAIIYIENPKLKSFKTQMAQNIKRLTNADYVNVKATTMEKCGLVGESKGIGCEVVCLITNKR